MKILSAAVLAAAALAGAASAQTSLVSTPPALPPAPSAGLCVLLGERGQVIDARIAQTSGDAAMDDDAMALVRKLQWAPPYPKPGWLGGRITLSQAAPKPAAPGSMPHCSAASDAATANTI